MENELRKINCYSCGKENLGIFFCDEECHKKWMATHPVNGKRKYSIEEIQAKILAWKGDPKRWKPAFSGKEVGQMSQSELADLFS